MHMDTQDFSAMEAVLRDACTRARQTFLPLVVMLQLYRSVASLARALLRARADAGLPLGLGDELIVLLDAARDAACAHFPEPEMPVTDAIRIHRAVVALAGVARRARAGVAHRARAGQPLGDVESVQPAAAEIEPVLLQPAEPLYDPAEPLTEAAEPLAEYAEPESPLSVWRADHKADRDQRAHELLRTVVEERLFAKIKAMNQREREEQEAA